VGIWDFSKSLTKRSKINALELQLKAIQTLFSPALTANLSAQVWGQGYNNESAIYPNWTTTSATNYYTTTDQVYAVVNKVAETTSLIPFYVYYQKDQKSLRKLQTLTNRQFYSTKGLYDISMMHMKALTDAPDSDPLVKLLQSPNAYQSQQEFFLSAFCYYLLSGECFIYKYRPGDGANTGNITELHVLAPSTIILHVSREYPQRVTGYEFVIDGQTLHQQIAVEDMIHIKKFNPERAYGYDVLANYARFRGLSPLLPATKLLTRLTSSDDRSVSQIQNGGLPGIVYDETLSNEEVSQETVDNMKKHFYSYIRNPDNAGIPLFTAGKKAWVPVGLKMADMSLIELQNMDFKRLCNIYKVSTILFNSDVAATENNVKEMIKQMYTSVCLPLAYTFRDKFNSELANEYKAGIKRYVDVDISGITELQDDYKNLAILLADLPVTPTGNEIRELFKWDRVENPLMDTPLVKQGYSVIDDLGFAAPVQ
jgi:HK97 family phage portal protein